MENMELERTLCARATEMGEAQERHSENVATLKERIGELETPMGRGRAGELDVAQTLRDVGLHVEDTSIVLHWAEEVEARLDAAKRKAKGRFR
mgnify:CR=1 FL=1